jgi:hypothetical protein
MPDDKSLLVYTADGTPYHIPTDQMAQFEVTGASLAKLQENAAKDPEEGTSSPPNLTAYHIDNVGPRPVPDWPIGARASTI